MTDHQGYVRNCFWIPNWDDKGNQLPLPFSNESGPVTCTLDGYAVIPRSMYNELCLMSRVPTMASRMMGANVKMGPKEAEPAKEVEEAVPEEAEKTEVPA